MARGPTGGKGHRKRDAHSRNPSPCRYAKRPRLNVNDDEDERGNGGSRAAVTVNEWPLYTTSDQWLRIWIFYFLDSGTPSRFSWFNFVSFVLSLYKLVPWFYSCLFSFSFLLLGFDWFHSKPPLILFYCFLEEQCHWQFSAWHRFLYQFIHNKNVNFLSIEKNDLFGNELHI